MSWKWILGIWNRLTAVARRKQNHPEWEAAELRAKTQMRDRQVKDQHVCDSFDWTCTKTRELLLLLWQLLFFSGLTVESRKDRSWRGNREQREKKQAKKEIVNRGMMKERAAFLWSQLQRCNDLNVTLLQRWLNWMLYKRNKTAGHVCYNNHTHTHKRKHKHISDPFIAQSLVPKPREMPKQATFKGIISDLDINA